MAIKKPIPISFNLDSHNSVQSVCAVIHIDDKNTETLDLSLLQGGEHVETPSNLTVTARFVRVKDKILISDNVTCTVQENGNIHVPIDNAAAHMLVGEIKIEINIVDENDILTMQFPLVVKVNNTILADAEISPESEGTIPELLEEAREAAESATQAAEAATEAIGTKQDKLTAGENITIEGNVISATGGGVTSYKDLTDKPYVTINDNSGAFSSWAITDEIYFATGEFFGTHTVDGEINISLDSSVSRYHNEQISYNFNRFSSAPYNGCLKLQHSFVSNFPSALNRIDTSKPYFLTQHFNTSELGKRERYAFRKVSGYSRDGDFIEYAQICYINYHSYLDNEIISQTDWVELTGGGSQIVSGVVNANGTITFTDSEGNSFTTSGESVIGPQGAPGQDYVLTAQDKTDIANIVLAEFTGSIVNGELNTR